MFKLHGKHCRPDISGNRIDFRFSGIRALQVPKGWDNIFVFIASVKTGKTINESGKASVRNGNCQWTEAFSESLWISENEASEDPKEGLLKFVVAMGPARFSILGEATINLASYMSSKDPIPLSLPLKKCNHGTVVQVQIQCLTPKSKLSNDKWKETISHMEDTQTNFDEMENNSDVSDGVFSSTGYPCTNHLNVTSHDGEHCSRGTSFSASGSCNSFDSMEGSCYGENFSPLRNLSEIMNDRIGGKDSTSSQNGAFYDSYSIDSPARSSNSSFKSKVSDDFRRIKRVITTSPLRYTNSSKDGLKAAEVMIEELPAEARMWEQNAQKTMHDLEMLRMEFSDQSKIQADLELELSASHKECGSLKQEIEQLKILLMDSVLKQEATVNTNCQVKNMNEIHKELDEEMKFLKNSNVDLELQLRKAQESNIELVSILQELENTIEQQKMEMENLLVIKLKLEDMEKYNAGRDNVKENSNRVVSSNGMRETSFDSDLEANSVEQPMNTLYAEFEPGNDWKLNLELRQLKKSKSCLEYKIQFLERALKEKEHEIVIQKSLRDQSLLEGEMKWRSKSTAKDYGITIFEENLSKPLRIQESRGVQFVNGGDEYVNKTLVDLKEKVLDLERDCNELTNENLALIFNLKESEKKSSTCQRNLEFQISDLQREKIQLEENFDIMQRENSQNLFCLDNLRNDMMVLSGNMNSQISANKVLERKSSELQSSKHELEVHLSELEEENVQLSECISGLESQLRYLTDERESSRLELQNSEAHVTNLLDDINRLETEMGRQKFYTKQKLQDIQKRWLKNQEEYEYLKVENPKLQSTAEGLMEECSSLQKSYAELRKQKMDVEAHSTIMESQLKEERNIFSVFYRESEALEAKFSLALEETASKERFLMSELDAVVDEHIQYKEKLSLGEGLLNQMFLGKVAEVENLRREISLLTEQISATHDEEASKVVLQVSTLCADKENLGSILQEVQESYSGSESRPEVLRTESGSEVLKRMGKLASSRKKQEVLLADHEKPLQLLEDFKSSKEDFNNTVYDLEVKLKSSKHERPPTGCRNLNFYAPLQKAALLQDEVLYAQKGELENELGRIKIKDSQFKTIKDLEEEKKERSERVHALEQEARHTNEEKADDPTDMSNPECTRNPSIFDELEVDEQQIDPQIIRTDHLSKIQILEIQLAEALEANELYKIQLKRFLSDTENQHIDAPMQLTGKDVEVKNQEECKELSLDVELRDLREQYLQMSLKYAEAEAQREDLVMKLKAVNGTSRFR